MKATKTIFMTKPKLIKVIQLIVNIPEEKDLMYSVRRLWKENDRESRKDGPSLIYSDGGVEWSENGSLNRDPREGPALECPTGEKEYWFKRKQVRLSEDGEWLFVDSAEKVFPQNEKL